MKKFNIEVISKKAEKTDGFLAYVGQIVIGDFTERFDIPIDSWSIEQYKQQWKEGIKRLEKHDYSCLVVTAQNLRYNPLIETWVLYKERDMVFIQNELLNREIIKEYHLSLDLSVFNDKTCYQFVTYPRETITEDGTKISEWKISVDDFFASTNNILT